MGIVEERFFEEDSYCEDAEKKDGKQEPDRREVRGQAEDSLRHRGILPQGKNQGACQDHQAEKKKLRRTGVKECGVGKKGHRIVLCQMNVSF